jgi:S1-C subfamily serine protease
MCNNQAHRLDGLSDEQLENKELSSTLMIVDIPGVKATESAKPPQPIIPPDFKPIPKTLLPVSFENDNSNYLKQIEKSLLYIKVGIGEDIGYGSGFIVSSEGHAITCHHVVDGAETIRARIRTNNVESWHDCELLHFNASLDLAMIKLPGDSFTPVVLAAVDRGVEKGEPIALLGYPMGDTLASDSNYFEGAVTSVQKLGGESAELIQISAQAYPGNSGGPMFSTKDGRVLGVLLGALAHQDAKGINFCRPIKYAWDEFIQNEEVS